ncbi:MAG: PH domain-containing protein [Candidatus Latescibacteria bacterium]|jgi:uncharacterized protein|nr:PH domain-containing protein [Candidatus Latescibacterota bacterium]
MKPLIVKPEKEHKAVMFVVWSIVLFIGLAFCIPFLLFVPDFVGKLIFGIILTIFLLIMALIALWIPAFFKTLEYCIESEAVKLNRGVFWKKRITVPFNKITNVDVSQGPLQRMFGLGTIHVQTAGAGGAQGAQAELRMTGVKDFDGLKDVIMGGVRGFSSLQFEKTTADTSDPDILINILEELRAIRRVLDK